MQSAVARLDILRSKSRDAARTRYDLGPGRKRPMLDHLPNSNMQVKKNKKTASAYLSRFQQQEYDGLLAAEVASAEAERNAARSKADAAAREHTYLVRRIAELQTQIDGITQNSVVVEACDVLGLDLAVQEFDVDDDGDSATEFSSTHSPGQLSVPSSPLSPLSPLMKLGWLKREELQSYGRQQELYLGKDFALNEKLTNSPPSSTQMCGLVEDPVARADKLIEIVLSGKVKPLSAESIAQILDPQWKCLLPMPPPAHSY
jgi:hypothetical protein